MWALPDVFVPSYGGSFIRRKQRLMQQGSRSRWAGIIESTKKSKQSNLLLGINTNECKCRTRNSQQTINTIYTRGGCHLQGNLVANADGVFPQMEWGSVNAETPCRLERGSWSRVLTITSFANMTVPTLTQGPATGTIVSRSTMLSGVEGMLGWDVWWGWSMG